MGREGDEQWHDQEHLAEELEAREVERDGHVRRAVPLVWLSTALTLMTIFLFSATWYLMPLDRGIGMRRSS